MAPVKSTDQSIKKYLAAAEPLIMIIHDTDKIAMVSSVVATCINAKPADSFPMIVRVKAIRNKKIRIFKTILDFGAFLLVLRNVIQARNQAGLQVPQVDKLKNMYEKKMEECEEILARLQGKLL